MIKSYGSVYDEDIGSKNNHNIRVSFFRYQLVDWGWNNYIAKTNARCTSVDNKKEFRFDNASWMFLMF